MGHLCGLQVLGANSVISDSRGGNGPQPLGVHQQVTPTPQSPHESAQWWTLQLSTTHCCSQVPGNEHALMLPLPHALGATIFLRVTVTSKIPSTRRILHHLPVGPCDLQEPANEALATSASRFLQLPGRMHSTLKIKSKNSQNPHAP